MRAKEITEVRKIKDFSYGSNEKLGDFIKRNCQPWLRQTNRGNYAVYRGFRSLAGKPLPIAFIQSVRKNRRPMDTSVDLHKMFNLMIQMAGKKANRSNSIFVSGTRLIAEYYGPDFVILPIGEFHYTWSADMEDWYSIMDYEVSHIASLGNIDPSEYATKDFIENELGTDWIHSIRGDDGTLVEAIEKDFEIMISCKKYLAIQPEDYAKLRYRLMFQ